MTETDQRDSSHEQDRAVPVAVATPVAVPVTPAPARGNSLLALPVLSGLCCLGLILLLIASTIILALIPLYTAAKTVESELIEDSRFVDLDINSGAPLASGRFNAAQNRILQDRLQQALNNDTLTKDATISVLNGTTTATSGRRRKRQITRVRLFIRLIFRRPRSRLLRLLLRIRLFIIDSSLVVLLNGAATTAAPATTTTVAVTTTTNSTGNRTRRLVRRSLEEGGAPAGFIYIDAHQVAAIKGDVSSVSFYVDQTCASATVEFGAFELLNRNMDKNTAELRLIKRSGQLKLGKKAELKPFMTLTTINLCGGNDEGRCQGQKFPVLPHQYIGVRSDKCRLGFAPVAEDPMSRTTWKAADQADPFAEDFDHLHYAPADYTVLHTVTIDSAEADSSDVLQQHVGAANEQRVLFVGTYPPRQCGIAKFLEDLTDAYPGPHSVVALDEGTNEAKNRVYSSKVVYRLNQTDRNAYYRVADMVNSEAFDALNIQHEYGLYGGMLGEYVIGMLAAVRKPVITTMHTVIPKPTSMYLSVTRALCATSTRVVVMSELGRRLLMEVYGIDHKKIAVVAHGVPDVPFAESSVEAKEALDFDLDAPTMATFGLLHRNKNVEVALQGLSKVVQAIPNLKYYVIGETHPAVVRSEGESYRHALEANVTALGLTKNVEFVDKYVTDGELLKYLAATDIYLTPYGREDQYVSGTLSWAVGLGKAVVSTPYMYAKELLADGRGFLFPFGDSAALSDLLIQVIEDDKLRNEARRRAYQYGRYMTWNSVAIHLQAIVRELVNAADK